MSSSRVASSLLGTVITDAIADGRTRRTHIAAFLAAAILVGACGSSGSSIPPAPSPGPTATGTATAALAALAALELQATIDRVGSATALVALDDAVWVLDHSSAFVRRIDPTSNAVTAKVALGGGFANGLGHAGSWLWTFHQSAGEVIGIDPATAEIATTISAGSDGDWFFVGDDAAWLISGDTLVRIDAETDSVTRTPLDGTCRADGVAAG